MNENAEDHVEEWEIQEADWNLQRFVIREPPTDEEFHSYTAQAAGIAIKKIMEAFVEFADSVSRAFSEGFRGLVDVLEDLMAEIDDVLTVDDTRATRKRWRTQEMLFSEMGTVRFKQIERDRINRGAEKPGFIRACARGRRTCPRKWKEH